LFEFAVQEAVGRRGGFGVFVLMEGLVFVVRAGGIEGIGRVAGAAADFVEAKVAGDGEEPGGEFGGNGVAIGGLEDLEEDVLGQVLSLGGIMNHAAGQVHDRLLVLVHQCGKSLPITLFDPYHQGGIRFQFTRHAAQTSQSPFTIGQHQQANKVARRHPPGRSREGVPEIPCMARPQAGRHTALRLWIDEFSINRLERNPNPRRLRRAPLARENRRLNQARPNPLRLARRPHSGAGGG
jgi:hypothetical protein